MLLSLMSDLEIGVFCSPHYRHNNDVVHLDSEEVHGPPGTFLLPGLGALPPLVDDGRDPVHSVPRHPEPRLAAGQGRLVPEKKEDNK